MSKDTRWDRNIETFSDEQLLFELVRRNGFQRSAKSMNDERDAELKAFALGYYDGRTEGVESDPYVADNLRHLYRRGYDAGIAEYSAIDHDGQR